MDTLDVLMDLQREGLIRSISGRRMPPSLLRDASACSFSLDSNQISLNLLNPTTSYTSELLLACQDTKTPLLVDGILAGGLLTDRHVDQPAQPYLFEFTPTERNYLQSALKKWAEHYPDRKGKVDWECFQRHMISVLSDLALKYSVSVASVALRWALQLEHVTSVVAACRIVDLDEAPYDRPKALRDVFSFELDDQDMEQLWEATGRERPSSQLSMTDFDFDGFEQGGDGLFVPNDRERLWL
jgi:aryl-alcohol dehydrogenase-like predicted oxidoreductase